MYGRGSRSGRSSGRLITRIAACCKRAASVILRWTEGLSVHLHLGLVPGPRWPHCRWFGVFIDAPSRPKPRLWLTVRRRTRSSSTFFWPREDPATASGRCWASAFAQGVFTPAGHKAVGFNFFLVYLPGESLKYGEMTRCSRRPSPLPLKREGGVDEPDWAQEGKAWEWFVPREPRRCRRGARTQSRILCQDPHKQPHP